MLNIENALWFIEKELGSDLNLSRVASHCGLSPFALARSFALATGWSVMRYIRARRLSQAALALRRHDSDILHIALAAGYGSHEAFTRAFSDLFGVPPKEARTFTALSLVEPLRMKEIAFITLPEPRFETRAEFIISGLSERFTFDKNEGIVGLWQAFIPYLGRVPSQVDGRTYGLCCHPGEDGSFDYIAGLEVTRTDALPPAFRHLKIAPHPYAVFRHTGHVSTLHQTFFTIFNHWLPASNYQAAEAPEFELYSEDFDPSQDAGYVEVWVPVVKK